MKNIEIGNIDSQIKQHKGWLFGEFVNPELPFHSKNFEFKWGKHAKGESRAEFGASPYPSLAILVYGKVNLTFQGQNTKVLLANEGDYIYYPANAKHSWKILEDSLLLTFRFLK